MKPDLTLQELWLSKDARSRRFSGDTRALCLHLMDNQETRQGLSPLVSNLTASRAKQEERITKLPPPVSGEVLMPDDPIIAELREIRAVLQSEREGNQPVLREEPPAYGATKN